MNRTRLGDFLSFAIKNETEAAELYEKYVSLVKSAAQKELLQAMAAMERGHEGRLKALAAGENVALGFNDKAVDLHISDFQVDVTLKPESSLEDAMIFAMKAEQKAFELYQALAGLEEDPEVKALLMRLASEEKRHKYDLETRFEKRFQQEN